MESVIITGANSGIGKETAKQLASIHHIKKIYLFCRNKESAKEAQFYLEKISGRKIFRIVQVDLCDFDSIKNSVKKLSSSVDGLIMNAGSINLNDTKMYTKSGATYLAASNLLGHVILLNELLNYKLLKKVAVYSSSEIIRGVPILFIKKPNFKCFTVEEFKNICDGSFFKEYDNANKSYGYLKYIATLWMSYMSREFKNIRFVSVSPGTTFGKNNSKKLMTFKKLIIHKILIVFGLMHKLEVGAKRYVDVLLNDTFKTGLFYGSPIFRSTGDLVEQNNLYINLNNKNHQENAFKAISYFVN